MNNLSIKNRLKNGFTIIEMVVTIAIVGIVALVLSQIATVPILSYSSITKRIELSNQISQTAQIIKKEMRNALPNSIRITQGVGTVFVEFLPIKNAGRYRKFLTDTGSGDFLNFSTTDTSFDILTPGINFSNGDRIVIENLNLPGFNVYNHDNSSLVVSPFGTNTQNIVFEDKQFPTESVSSVFYVINTPITYYCNTITGEFLKFTNYNIQSIQPTNINSAPLQTAIRGVAGKNMTRCNFEYLEGDNTRNGIFTIEIESTLNNEKVSLFTQISILNH